MTPRLDFLSLLQATSEVFGVNAAAIRGRGRKAGVALARQVAMAIASDQGLSPGSVGLRFLRDRATVLHACRTVREITRNPNDPRRPKIIEVVGRYREIAAQNQPHQ